MVQAEVASGRNAGESRRKSVNGDEIESNETKKPQEPSNLFLIVGTQEI